jgi:hypothetical protein
MGLSAMVAKEGANLGGGLGCLEGRTGGGKELGVGVRGLRMCGQREEDGRMGVLRVPGGGV